MTDPAIEAAAQAVWDETPDAPYPWKLASDDDRTLFIHIAYRTVTAFFRAIPEASNADQ